jgi:hypothetical protein
LTAVDKKRKNERNEKPCLSFTRNSIVAFILVSSLLEASTWSVVILVMGDVADKIQKVRVFPMTFENVMADEVNFSSSIEHALVGYCRIY